jgi:hypothetical protein
MNVDEQEYPRPLSTDELAESLRSLDCGATFRLDEIAILKQCHEILGGNMSVEDLDLNELDPLNL